MEGGNEGGKDGGRDRQRERERERQKKLRIRRAYPYADVVQNVYAPPFVTVHTPDIVYIWNGQFCPSTPTCPSPAGAERQSGVPGTSSFSRPFPLYGPMTVPLIVVWPT